jgi:hypothetical protein
MKIFKRFRTGGGIDNITAVVLEGIINTDNPVFFDIHKVLYHIGGKMDRAATTAGHYILKMNKKLDIYHIRV